MYKNCPICNSKFYPFILAQTYSIHKCKKCGLGKTINLKPYYGNYHRDQQYIEDEDLFENIFQKRVRIINHFKESGNVLEVGCSTGLMLKFLKIRAYSVLGVEISRPAANIARRRGIQVVTKPYEVLKTNERFDVIIFNHTLEHLKNPFDSIKKSSKLLNKKGILYIDLPNFDSLESRILKSKWPYLLPEEHIWHFTYESLSILLNKSNLEVIFNERASGIWDLDNPLKDIVLSLFSFRKRFVVNLVGLIPSYIATRIRMGNDLMVIARRND